MRAPAGAAKIANRTNTRKEQRISGFKVSGLQAGSLEFGYAVHIRATADDLVLPPTIGQWQPKPLWLRLLSEVALLTAGWLLGGYPSLD